MRSFAALLSYLKFLLCVAALAAGGYYVYQRFNPPPPITFDKQKPSEALAPFMAGNLPKLFAELGGKQQHLAKNFDRTIDALSLQADTPDALQPAWRAARQLGDEMRSIASERKIARGAFLQKGGAWQGKLQPLLARLDDQEAAKRRAYYLEAPEDRWKIKAAEEKEVVKNIYLKVLAAEKPVSTPPVASATPQALPLNLANVLTCPLCGGEGRIVVHRPIGGTLSDVSTACPLCLGTGKRTLHLPAGAAICPDCKGFGKLLFSRTGLIIPNPTETFSEAPQVTGCTRCLSRGYVLQNAAR